MEYMIHGQVELTKYSQERAAVDTSCADDSYINCNADKTGGHVAKFQVIPVQFIHEEL